MCQKHCRNTSDYWEDGISAFLYRLAGCQGMLFPVVGGRWLGRIGSVIEIMHFYCSSKVAGGVQLPLTFLRTRYIYMYRTQKEREEKGERATRWKSTQERNKARKIPRNVAFTIELHGVELCTLNFIPRWPEIRGASCSLFVFLSVAKFSSFFFGRRISWPECGFRQRITSLDS